MKAVILKDKNGVPIYPLANANYKRELLNKAYLNEASMDSMCSAIEDLLNNLYGELFDFEVIKSWVPDDEYWDFSIIVNPIV